MIGRRRRSLGKRLARLRLNEKSGVLRAQNDILITNNRTMAAWKHKFNPYGKTLQIFRFPKSHLLRVGKHRRRDRNDTLAEGFASGCAPNINGREAVPRGTRTNSCTTSLG